ncbi:MAG: hypothetical protein ACK4GB_05690 [Tepidimonas sp.]
MAGILGALAGLAQAAPVTAQVLPVEPPTLQRGDRWAYRKVDDFTGRETARFELIFARVEGERLMFRNGDLTGPENASTVYQTLDQRPCRRMQDSEQEVWGGSMRMPIAALGERWSVSKLPWRNGKGYYDADCEAKAVEDVKTEAGTFPTVRIECKGFWTRVFDGSSSGRYEEKLWYAPAAKRFVKSESRTWRRDGRPDTHTTTELVEMQLQ